MIVIIMLLVLIYITQVSFVVIKLFFDDYKTKLRFFRDMIPFYFMILTLVNKIKDLD